MGRSKPTATLCAATVLLLAAAPQTAAATGRAPQLTAGHAVRMMRTVLIREFGPAWKQARGHALTCPVPVHPERGGATQEREIRRRCFFAWSLGRAAYSGKSLVWLGGADLDGSRHWLFQFSATIRTGSSVRPFNQSGAIHEPQPGP